MNQHIKQHVTFTPYNLRDCTTTPVIKMPAQHTKGSANVQSGGSHHMAGHQSQIKWVTTKELDNSLNVRKICRIPPPVTPVTASLFTIKSRAYRWLTNAKFKNHNSEFHIQRAVFLIALSIFHENIRGLRYTFGNDPVSIVYEAGWAPVPVCIGVENLAPPQDSIPGPSSP